MRIKRTRTDKWLHEGDGWHEWFAWRPVSTVTGHYVWLERVSRRKMFDGDWHYGTLYWESYPKHAAAEKVKPESGYHDSLPWVETDAKTYTYKRGQALPKQGG